MKTHQKGATMLEALATLMIISVLSISGIRLIGSLFAMFRQNVVANEIKEIKKSIQDRFAYAGDYRELEGKSANEVAEMLLEEKVIPNQMSVNGKIYHRLGGEVTIELSDYSDTGLYFDVTFKDLTTQGCLNLSQIDWVINQNSDLMRLIINDKTFVLPVGNNKDKTEGVLPVPMSEAVKACKSSSDNDITWTFQ